MSPQEEKTEVDAQVKDYQDDRAVEDVELAETEDGSGEKADDDDDKRIKMKISADAPWKDRMWEVFTTFWPLGFVAFGGPQAHVAILRDHLVIQRDWLDEEQFTELFAIGQVSRSVTKLVSEKRKHIFLHSYLLLTTTKKGLPGPTSTQLVISTALSRAGPLGGLMALILWNLPGLVVLTLCGVLIDAVRAFMFRCLSLQKTTSNKFNSFFCCTAVH